jgi:hypothetical protein
VTPQKQQQQTAETSEQEQPSEQTWIQLRGRKRLCTLEVEPVERELDLRKPVMNTMLSFLHIHPRKPVQLLPAAHLSYRLSFYKQSINQVADADPFMDRLFKHLIKLDSSEYQVPTLLVCEKLRLTPHELNEQLFALQVKNISYLFRFFFEISDRLKSC